MTGSRSGWKKGPDPVDLDPGSQTLNFHKYIFQEYVDDIIELLVNEYLDPRDVCDAIQLCP